MTSKMEEQHKIGLEYSEHYMYLTNTAADNSQAVCYDHELVVEAVAHQETKCPKRGSA